MVLSLLVSCGNPNAIYTDNVKYGMSIQQVDSIMGKPDFTQIETLVDTIAFRYYYENAIIAAGDAEVAFKSDSTVAHAHCGCE